MRKLPLLVVALLVIATSVANAQIGSKNPDVPFGGFAIDVLASTGLGGSMESKVWDLVNVPTVGGQFLADGLTVRSNGDVSTINAGASFLVALSSRVTAQVHYVYSEQTIDHINYTSAGAVTNMRLAPPYEVSQSYHTVGIRFRVWFGSQVE